ncbi:flagellin N-terminal helical domain-containing protein [Rhizobium sp. SL86]|uniref:flagellin N-terminal helical domain-containing protein n=1 Tax=Rhizobium sp. SL86 TaxID=2995148 RepID=UPI0022731B25|nr:flagellin [Rhizobium sp. SL86]MCY1668202.1 flagellin [Rhizobium sp. SL86]
MVSTSVNSTAASALSLLGGTTRALSESTTRVASGREVQSASDNAAYWSIATTMKSTNLSLSSAEDAQAFSAAIADTAAVGMAHASEIMSEIQSKLILAKTPGVDKDVLNSEITQLKEQLGTVVDSSSFNGQNWLKTSASESPKMESMVGSVTSNARGDVSVNVINFDRSQSNLVAEGDASDGLLTRSYSGITKSGSAYDYYLLDAGSTTPAGGSAREIGLSSTTTDDEIDGMISAMNSMMKGMTDGGATIGATSSRIDTNADFLANLQDVTQIGIGTMVDANLEEESARLASLSVQQQLQTIGLNITNTSMAASLKIFA